MNQYQYNAMNMMFMNMYGGAGNMPGQGQQGGNGQTPMGGFQGGMGGNGGFNQNMMNMIGNMANMNPNMMAMLPPFHNNYYNNNNNKNMFVRKAKGSSGEPGSAKRNYDGKKNQTYGNQGKYAFPNNASGSNTQTQNPTVSNNNQASSNYTEKKIRN